MNDDPKESFGGWLPAIISSILAFALTSNLQSLPLATAAILIDFGDPGLVSIAFSLASLIQASLIILGGKLGMKLGLKRVLQIGSVIFIIGSILSTFSINSIMFYISWSIICPLGLILIIPSTASMITVKYDDNKRGIAFGVYAAFIGLAAALGPLIMGIWASFVTWKMMFIYCIILVVVSLILLTKVEETEKVEGSTDWVGTILIFFTFAPIIIGLGLLASNLIYIVVICVGLGFLAIFIWWSNRLDNLNQEPIFRVKIFQNRSFASPAIYYMLFIISIGGSTILIPQIFTLNLGMSAIGAAITMLAYTIPVFFVAFATGGLSDRFQPRYFVIIGSILAALGFTLFFLLFRQLPVLIDLILLGLVGSGAGLLIPQTQNLALSSVASDELGEASGLYNSMTDLGGAIGSAIVGALAVAAGYLQIGVIIIALILAFFIPNTSKSNGSNINEKPK